MDASNLQLFWTGVIAISIMTYVALDGFDLGIGILSGTTTDESLRDRMLEAIAPFWDGNETWLVAIGTSLFAAFPVVYAVFLSAFYIPILLLLLGLIFRGVAFEFRYQDRARKLWDRGFFLGSAVVAFVQGAAVGAMIRGIPVANGQYTGTSFDWLAPLSVVCGLGLMLGYALLGAGWLVLKSEGALREWARRRIPWLAAAVLIVLAVAFDAALADREHIAGALVSRRWGLIFPAIGLLAIIGVLVSARYGRDGQPFAMTLVFFLAAFLTLAVMFWPYLIPYSITIANAAAPQASLSFLFWGALVALPAIAAYTIGVYWLFRGKLGGRQKAT
jgi:cytochrome bd ubiquinol oxidase subunit II